MSPCRVGHRIVRSSTFNIDADASTTAFFTAQLLYKSHCQSKLITIVFQLLSKDWRTVRGTR